MLRRLMFYFFLANISEVSFKNSSFVDELMIRIIFVVDMILREYADSKKSGDSAIWLIGVHIANILRK